MKVQPLENIYGLEKTEKYDVIAYKSGYFLIQNPFNDFYWINTAFFEKFKLELEHLTHEQISDYGSNFKLPNFLLKENRQLDNGKYWRIFGDKLYEKLFSLKLMKENGFSLSHFSEELLKSDKRKFEIIKQDLSKISTLQIFASDGYNPSIFSASRIDSEGLAIEQIIQLRYDYNLGFKASAEVKVSKVDFLREALEELFNWGFIHLQSFTNISNHLSKDFYKNQILELHSDVIENIMVYSSFNNFDVYVHTQFPEEVFSKRMIVFLEKRFSVVIEVDNIIH